MRMEYNPEEKQLRIIATNLEEQDELAGLAGCMRHGDSINLNWNSDLTFIDLRGAICSRRGESLRIDLKDVESHDAAKQLLDVINFETFGQADLVFFWTEEIPVDGWNVLVLVHL